MTTRLSVRWELETGNWELDAGSWWLAAGGYPDDGHENIQS
jgi:hypothetical protein